MAGETESGKIYMLNALWFKAGGGAEKYREYMRAAAPFVQQYGGRKLESYVPERALIGEFDADLVFFVEYPSWEAFEEMIEDEGYKKNALPLREAAIRDSLLIQCRRPRG